MVDIIEDLIEIGADAIHPVQVSAAGMEPAALKEEFGDRMAFWGGVDTQQILPRGSVAEVKRAVEQCIEDMGEGGGYILGSVHNLQPDVPREHPGDIRTCQGVCAVICQVASYSMLIAGIGTVHFTLLYSAHPVV